MYYRSAFDILAVVSAHRIATIKSVNGRAFLAGLLILCFVIVTVGCGSARSISIDKKNAQQVAASWLGESNGRPQASCRRHVCEIGIRYSFVDASEAWLIAVPITTYYRGPDFPGVNRIILKITDKRRERVAAFYCSLRRESAGTHVTGVRDAHKMCKGSIAPTSDSRAPLFPLAQVKMISPPAESS